MARERQNRASKGINKRCKGDGILFRKIENRGIVEFTFKWRNSEKPSITRNACELENATKKRLGQVRFE